MYFKAQSTAGRNWQGKPIGNPDHHCLWRLLAVASGVQKTIDGKYVLANPPTGMWGVIFRCEDSPQADRYAKICNGRAIVFPQK